MLVPTVVVVGSPTVARGAEVHSWPVFPSEHLYYMSLYMLLTCIPLSGKVSVWGALHVGKVCGGIFAAQLSSVALCVEWLQ